MKFLLKFFSVLALFWIGLSSAFAIDAPSNFKIDSINDTSVDLSWDLVDNAYMYYVSFWSTSWGDYDNQTDFVEENTVSVSSLEIGSTYYFVVTSLDENWEESIFSDELSVDFDKNIFSLESVSVKSKTTLELTFSDILDSTEWTEREFNIYKKSDKLDTFEVISSELNMEDSSKLNLTLDKELELWVQYEIVVVAIKNESLKNIESWIDSIEWFIINEEDIINEELTTNSEMVTEGTIATDTTVDELNPASDEELLGTDTTVGELNSASSEELLGTDTTLDGFNSASNEELSVAWVNIEDGELENTTLGAAGNTDQLPKTWPESVLILILSIVLWALVFVFKYKKA